MKKVLLTVALVTVPLAINASNRRTPAEILNDLYLHHTQVRTAKDIIDDANDTLYVGHKLVPDYYPKNDWTTEDIFRNAAKTL